MRTVIAHGHIFKNAGSTFDWALKKNFGDGFCDHRDDVPMRRQGASYLENFLQENVDIKAISSHHMCDTSDVSEVRVIPSYILRHPIERVVSVYNFERKQGGETPGSVAAQKYNFRDYIKWRMEPDVSPTIRNYQTIYLSGQLKRRPEIPVDDMVFVAAMERVRSGALVGLVEMFDQSMVLFEKILKAEFPGIDLSYIRQNSGKQPSHDGSKINYISDVLGNDFDVLLDNNSFDLSLYVCAKKLILSQIEQINDFEEQFQSFRKRCNEMSR